MKSKTILFLVTAFFTAVASLSAKDLVNTGLFSNVALKGHDPVAFFTESAAVKGKKSITADYQGATYRFSTEEHRRLFEVDPERYAPAFGGYCAYAVGAKNSLVGVDIDTWQIVDGRLILNYNEDVKRMFNADLARLLAEADNNWPGLVAAKGK